ncbi:glycine betaine ABC transporter substrate-binding protein [Desertibacillus haloalkaliphilus]|nr:glycine betaine ABC transporter substrate-binding protein [Desertibacillus haloalkaliphilus]
MKFLVASLAFALLSVLLIGCGTEETSGNDTDSETEKGTITVGVTPWSSTVPPTNIAKLLLEDLGYTVELQSADAGAVYTGMSRGDIDVFMDAWLPDMHGHFMERYGDDIDQTALSYPDGELGWVVPSYVEGIDSIDDLKGNEEMFDGKVYGIEEGGGMTITSREMIEELGFDLEYVSSSEAGMLSQAMREIGQEEPVLFLGWRPHTMFVNWDIKVLEGQEEYFPTSEIHVLTNINFQDTAPAAYEFLSNWSMPVEEIEKMIAEIEDGADEVEVAREWIENNQQHVSEMLGE